jgi:hypothetical protein
VPPHTGPLLRRRHHKSPNFKPPEKVLPVPEHAFLRRFYFELTIEDEQMRRRGRVERLRCFCEECHGKRVLSRRNCRIHYGRYPPVIYRPAEPLDDGGVEENRSDDNDDGDGGTVTSTDRSSSSTPPLRARSQSPIAVRPGLPPPPEPSDEPPPATSSESKYEHAVRALLLQLLDKKALHHETQASVASTLLIIRAALGPYLPPDLLNRIPRTWHKCMAYVEPHLPKREEVHSCPNECGVFFVDEHEDLTVCPTRGCGGERYNSKTEKPTMVTHYFDVVDRLRMRFGCAVYAKLLEYPHTREPPAHGGYADIQDGSRWRDDFVLHFGESKYNVGLAVSSDSFPIDRKRKRSVTPILAQLVNLPPYLRAKVGAQLLIMEIPNRAKKVDIYLQLLMRNIARLQSIKGVRMWNEYVKRWVTVRCTVLFDNNDLVAAPKISGTKAGGSIVGACHICDVRGLSVKALRTRVYTGAHRYLASDDKLRFSKLLTSTVALDHTHA